MYSAFDYPSQTVAHELIEQIRIARRALGAAPLHDFVLIDGAFDAKFFEERFRASCPRISIHTEPMSNGFGSASPFLAELDELNLGGRILVRCIVERWWKSADVERSSVCRRCARDWHNIFRRTLLIVPMIPMNGRSAGPTPNFAFNAGIA